MKILLTGFKSIKNGLNSSETLINSILGNYDKFLFTNDYSTIIYEIDELLKDNKYDYIIMFGQKPLIKNLRIELICKKEKEILKTNFNIEKIEIYLKKNNIDYKLSENPGTSYCNFVYYNMLKYIKTRGFRGKAIFVHIPFLNNFREYDRFVNLFLEGK